MKLKLSEQSYRTAFLEALTNRLKDKEYLVIEEGSYTTPNDNTTKIPDIVIAKKQSVVKSGDELFIAKNGVSAIVETKKPKRESKEGFGQAVQYAIQLGCPLGFTTNFKDIMSFSLGDNPQLGGDVFGEEPSEEATRKIAGYVVDVIEGRIHLTPTEKNEPKVIDLLEGGVKEILACLVEVDPSLLKNPLGIITETMDVRERSKDALDNTDVVIKQASAYLVVNQLLFYAVLSATDTTAFPTLKHIMVMAELQDYFDRVLVKDYQAVFSAKVVTYLPNRTVNAVNEIIDAIVQLKLERIKQDLLGKIFTGLIPFELRKRLGAYYTSSPAAEFLARLAITFPEMTVLDPSCGSGTLLVGAYHAKKELSKNKTDTGKLHRELLSQIYGVDVTLFAAHLAVINLSLQEPLSETERVLVTNTDAFEMKPSQAVEFLAHSGSQSRVTQEGESKEEFVIPRVDLVIQNPPFTRSKRLTFKHRTRAGQVYDTYKSFLDTMMKHDLNYFRKGMGLHSYFMLHADDFLKHGGRYAAVLPSATLISDYSEGIKKYFLDRYHLEYIVTYETKATFSEGCLFKEVLLVARKNGSEENFKTKFVTLKKGLTLSNFAEVAKKVKENERDEDSDLMTVVHVTKAELQRQWNWMLYTKPRGLRDIINAASQNPLVKRGKLIFIPKEGLHIYEPEFFFIPNKNWAIDSKSIDALTIRNRDTGETLRISNGLLKPTLRKPELYSSISPKPDHYILLIPSRESLSQDVRRYVEIGEVNGHNNPSSWLSKNSKTRGIPWYSFAYDDERIRRSKGHIVILDKFRMKKRTCVAHFTEEEVTGSNNYYFGSTGIPESDKIIVGWLNSTIFLALFLALKREIAGDWSRWKIADLAKYPMLDPSKLSLENRKEILQAVDKLASASLPPIPKQLRKSPRKELDLAILKALKIPNVPLSLDNLYYAVETELSTL